MWLPTAQMQAVAAVKHRPRLRLLDHWIPCRHLRPSVNAGCTAACRCLLSVPALTLCPAMAGSYSYVAAGSCARTYEELAKPVRRRLLFAGEHTCKVHSLGLFGRMRASK